MKKTAVCVLLLVILSCDKDKVTPPNNNDVSVETITAQLINDGGVILTGNIKNVELPLNYGFVLSPYEGGTLESAYNSKFINGLHNGAFNIELNDNLQKGQIYYYNAVAYTSNRFVFGEEQSFVSNGNKAPLVESVVPLKAHLSDTIILRGKYFSKSPNVFFDEIQSDIIFKSDTLIKCIVPSYNQSQIPYKSLKIKKQTEEETIFNGFSLHTPEVHTMEPYRAHDSDTITINGDHFDNIKQRNRLTMLVNGSYSSLEIIESSRTKIKFINAGTYYDFHPKFKLTSQFQTIELNDHLEVELPTITGAPECLSFGETATITGTDFPRYIYDDFKIEIGGTPFYAKHVYRDSIVLNVNNTHYKDFELKDVVITYFDKEIRYKTSICIDEPWITVGYVDVTLTHNYQNEVYGIMYEGYQQPPQIGKFNTDNNKFESVTNEFIPQEVRYGPRVFNNGMLYHYTSYQSNPKAFKSYDIFTNQLKDLAPFPGENRKEGLIESVGDYIYFGLGASTLLQNFSDIWRYSIQNDTWEFVTNFPGIDSKEKAKEKPLSFVVGNKIFIAAGQRNNANSDFWVLDTGNNTVSPRESLSSPLAASWTVYANNATSYLNKGYYYNNYLEEYNVETNSWRTYSNIPSGGPSQGIFFYKGLMYRTSSGKLFRLNPLYLN